MSAEERNKTGRTQQKLGIVILDGALGKAVLNGDAGEGYLTGS